MTAPDLLASLTPEQREAAEYIGGPLRIIAGAGTGKTTTITARFVNLVHTHSVPPHEILAVTFSSKAATEMRQRIIKNLGLAHRRLWIQTFHSLCLRLLGEWQRQAGEPDPRVLSELERVRYLQTAVDSIPLNARRFYHGSHGTRVFVRDLATYSDRFADDLRPDLTDLSAVPPRHVDLERARLAYRDLITRDGVFDFASLGTETIRRLESDPALRTRTRALFRHMLVDEFQDTNHAQFRLIELLVPNGNQICVVGDENQAIYAFRGGRSEYFETFAARFPRTKTCRLRQNYRSGDEILHAANSLIGHNGVASDGAAQLALVATGDRHAIVTATESDSPELEAESVARRIIAITADSDSTIGFDDVAVLFRSVRTSVEPFRRAFNLYGIPFTLGPIVGLDYAIRQDIAAALRLALGPPQWTDAARLALRSGSNALDRQALERRFNSGHLAALLTTDPGTWPEMPTVEQKFLMQAQDIVLAATAIDRSSPAMLCYMAIRLAGHLHEGIDPVQARQLTQLVNTAATLPNAESVRDFVAAGKSDEDIPPDDPAGVSLLTIHAAKGLEWPVVFVAGLTEGTFPLPVRASHEADILAVSREQTETTSVTSAAEAELSHLREERRLAYVAVTRAKTQLHLSWSCTTGDEPAPISRFVGELAVLTGPRTPYDDEYERLTSMYALGRQLRIRQAVARTTDPAGEAGSLALGDLLVAQWASRHVPGVLPIRNRTTPTPYDDNASISFSPTSIKTYDDCPRRYLYSALLHLGSEEQGAAQTLGNAVHAALEELNCSRLETGAIPGDDRAIEALDRVWPETGFEIDIQRRQLHKRASAMIRRYLDYERSLPVGRTPVWIEKYARVPFGRHELRGKVDLVMRNPDGSVEILDFKTGGHEPFTKSRQLFLYIHLWKQSEPDQTGAPVSTTFVALKHEDDKGWIVGETWPKTLIRRPKVDASWLTERTNEIDELLTGIAQNDFHSNIEKCDGCAFRWICPDG